MAVLGLPYRIIYEAKNLTSGLTGIVVKLKKPDGSWIGPFSMTEESDPKMSGIYTYNLPTALSDPEGEWYGYVESPDENNYKRGIRISFRLSGGSGSVVDVECPRIVGTIRNTSKLTGKVRLKSLLGKIKTSKIKATVSTRSEIVGTIKNVKLKGRILCNNKN